MEMVFTLTGNVEIVILFGQSRTYQVIARFFLRIEVVNKIFL